MILDKSSQRLEWNKVLEQVLTFMPSQQTRALLSDRGFAGNRLEMDRRKAELSEAIGLYLGYSPLPGGALHEVEDAIKHALKGGILETEQFIDIGDSLRTMRKMVEFFQSVEHFASRFELLDEIAKPLKSFQSLEERIEKTIDYDGSVKSSASPELQRLRRKIASSEDAIRRKIDSFVTDPNYADYLQDQIVTLRNDRYVIPVKAEHKRRVPGMVHDRSSTGATLFVEPIALLELNNELRETIALEHEEIVRILKELSRVIGLHGDDILASHEAANLVFILFGLARYSVSIGGNLAETVDDKIIRLNKARHPLLDPETVVPMTMEFGGDDKLLIITGPNTGGKTVVLKTIGLVCLMNQFGLAIPASEGSRLPFFEQVYVDIGDEQSIEQSLSTFSSHMVNVIEILNSADQDSLVLLDELGAGTDPQEGAALARSVLLHLQQQRPLVFATSHYSEIKQFAMQTDGFDNASVEFDIQTLSPTYRLMMGVPGSSNAFDISRKLGMPEDVLETAVSVLDHSAVELENIIRELEKTRKQRDDDAREVRKLLDETKAMRSRYDERLQTIAQQREKILDQAKAEAKDLLRKTEDDAKDIMKQLRSMSAGKVDHQQLEAQQQKLREGKARLQTGGKKPKKVNPPKSLLEGESIYVPKLDSKGHVLSAPDKKGNFQAMIGILKMTLNISEVEKVKQEETKWIPPAKTETSVKSVDMKLDLRGKNMEEARIEVDRFLDQAVIGHAGQVEIIHGKGTGVLREFITGFLKKHPHVAEYRLGGYHEGGSGVTIVTLK